MACLRIRTIAFGKINYALRKIKEITKNQMMTMLRNCQVVAFCQTTEAGGSMLSKELP